MDKWSVESSDGWSGVDYSPEVPEEGKDEKKEYDLDTLHFLEKIEQAKKANVEFVSMHDDEYLKKMEYESKEAYLLLNLMIAIENVQRVYGNNEAALRNLKALTVKMKSELCFVAAACKELLKD
jgi:hypothetical protein